MSGIQQMLTGGTYKAPGPTTIGQAYGGGYYAGKISTAGTGVADYYLIVAPKASGNSSAKTWGPYGSATSATSVIDGPANSDALNYAIYPAAYFCRGLSIGGYIDWYLPAKNELEVLYYFLKPTTTANDTGNSGSNANAVSPEPISTKYTTGSPAQTASGINFRTGESEAFASNLYWSSTEYDAGFAWTQDFLDGYQSAIGKASSYYARAVRRVPV